MRNKLILSIIAISLVLAIIWYYMGGSTEKKPIVINADAVTAKKVIVEKTPDKSLNTHNSKPQTKIKYNTIPDEISIELSLQKFSQEPLLELVLLTKHITDCSRYSRFNFNGMAPSKKREKQALSFIEECKDFQSQYPNISKLRKNKKAELMFFALASESKYSELVQKGVAYKFMGDNQKQEFMQEIIQTALASGNGHIIAMLSEIFISSESHGFLKQLSGVLGTINLQYTQLIANQAIIQFSCQFSDGESCIATSHYMLQQCFLDANACGLDVQTWFQTNNTNAHNRDIKKLVDFFDFNY